MNPTYLQGEGVPDLTCACARIAGMAMDPTAENPVMNLPVSIQLQRGREERSVRC